MVVIPNYALLKTFNLAKTCVEFTFFFPALDCIVYAKINHFFQPGREELIFPGPAIIFIDFSISVTKAGHYKYSDWNSTQDIEEFQNNSTVISNNLRVINL